MACICQKMGWAESQLGNDQVEHRALTGCTGETQKPEIAPAKKWTLISSAAMCLPSHLNAVL